MKAHRHDFDDAPSQAGFQGLFFSQSLHQQFNRRGQDRRPASKKRIWRKPRAANAN